MASVTIPAQSVKVTIPASTQTVGGVTVSFPATVINVSIPAQSVQSTDPVTTPAATDKLVFLLSGDPYLGNPFANLAVDGVALGKVEIKALHANGEVQVASFVGNFSKSKSATMSLDADAYGGTPATDRNAYVIAVYLNDKSIALDKTSSLSSGEVCTATFNKAGATAVLPSVPAQTSGSTGTVTPPVVVVPIGTVNTGKAGNPYASNPEAIPAGAVDVTTIGFKGDGSFDNTPLFESSKQTVLYFPAGTYVVSASPHFKGGVTYFGAKGAVIKAKVYGQPLGYLDGDNTVIKGLTFSGGQLGSWDVSNKTITVQYCTFQDFKAGGDWDSGHFLFFQHGCSGKIQFNTFKDRTAPDSVNLDYHVKGSIPDFGCGWTPDHQDWSNKDMPPCGIMCYGPSDLEISYNTFTNVLQPIKTLMLPGEAWNTHYSVQSGLKINYNYAEQVHRIFIEQQSVNTGLQVIGNVAKNWKFPYWESYFLSLASPQSTGTVCKDNFGYHGDTPYNASPSGLGIEFGSQQGQCVNNTVYGPWMIQTFSGSKGCKVNGNRIASNNTDPNFQFAGVQDENNPAGTDTDYSGNDIRKGGGTFPAEWAKYDISK